MSDLSVTTCWSCGESLVAGTALLAQQLDEQATSPIHPSSGRRLVGPGVWATVLVLLAVTFGAVWWITRGPEQIDFPATLGGFDRNNDPIHDIVREEYAEQGASVNTASWGTASGYSAMILRDTPERAEAGFMEAFLGLGGDIDKPVADRSFDGVRFRCYQNDGVEAIENLEAQTWCGWIDGGELGFLVHHDLGEPPMDLAVQLHADIQS